MDIGYNVCFVVHKLLYFDYINKMVGTKFKHRKPHLSAPNQYTPHIFKHIQFQNVINNGIIKTHL